MIPMRIRANYPIFKKSSEDRDACDFGRDSPSFATNPARFSAQAASSAGRAALQPPAIRNRARSLAARQADIVALCEIYLHS